MHCRPSTCPNHRSLLLTALLLGMALPSPASAAAGDFDRTIAPILARNCLSCHNASEAKGGLDLSRRETLLRGGKGGAVVVAGRPDESPLLQRVQEGTMPPRGKGTPLDREAVATLRAWVAGGVAWPAGRSLSAFEYTTDHRAGYDWWAFQPPARPPVPRVQHQEWVRTPVDAFILQQLEQRGLSPAPEADRATFLRRATFDLLGLPPTPEEIDAFLADRAPDAYEKVIDRLLASPHYGERWGRHWLDVARYGESDGFENDKPRDHAWPYRDYVIRSFNQDKPYGQFIREQLAGDMLQPLTRDGLLATGFLVAGAWDEIQNVGKSKLERLRAHEEQMEELVGTVAQAFLGLTVNCARCHDHKFDPIPQTDYYRLKAIFDGVDHGSRAVFTPEEQQAHDRAVAPIQTRIRELKAALQDLSQRDWEALAAPLAAGALVPGRFGQALDARRARPAVKSQPAYHKPPFTVDCWARLDSKRGFNVLVANNLKESGEHWEIYTYAGSGEFSAYFPGYEPAEVRSGVDVTDGAWHYLAMTFDGRRVRLYVDARLVKQADLTRRQPPGALGLLYFGGYPPQKIGCDGLVDEVRLTSGVWKIDRIPDAPLVADKQTLGLWHLDGGSGERFTDLSLPPPAASAPAKQQEELLAALRREEARLAAHPVPMAYIGVRKQPEPTVVYLRGEVQKPGPQVTPGALTPVRVPPAELGLSAASPEGERRLRFAEWVAHPDHPLTARVLVNRVWQYHFGQGLVETPSDLGFHAGRPSHPALLDWLAREFVAQGGSIKRLHRLLMLSATYRQSSRYDPKAAARDADNRLLWRFAPRRLEAETVRDALLAVSGELNGQMSGPSFRPFTITVFNTYFYHLVDRDTPEFNRRTIYRMAVNTGRSPLLDALDCPAPSVSMPRRRATTTPLQALALMNDPFVLRQAERLAGRVRRTAGGNATAQVELLYRIVLGRPPRVEERSATLEAVRQHGLENACWALVNASEFLHVR